MTIKPGLRLGQRYQLLSPIATGGMGQVWRAEDTTLHRIVAAKILRSEFSGDEKFVARFRAEARNTAALSHPNIASVYDYGEQVQDAEQLAYLVMELVEGEPLVDILLRERRLSPNRTLDYLEQTAMGLAAAHREGMVHRDVKPGNLIIRPDGVLKITDFGIARAANAVALTEQGTVVGTAQYLAPEQAEGQPARPASDIYALGVVGYECLAGFRPFDGDNSVAIALSQIRDTPRPLPADVPQHVRTLIELTMAKNPDARYRDGTAYVAAVREVRDGRSPRPPVRQAPPAPPVRQLPGQPAPGVAPRPYNPSAPGPSAPGPSAPGPSAAGHSAAAPAAPGPSGPGRPAGPPGPGGPTTSGGPSAPGGPGSPDGGASRGGPPGQHRAGGTGTISRPTGPPVQPASTGAGAPSRASGTSSFAALPTPTRGPASATDVHRAATSGTTGPPRSSATGQQAADAGRPAPRMDRLWWVILAAVAAIAIVVAIVLVVNRDSSGDDNPPSPTTTAAATTEQNQQPKENSHQIVEGEFDPTSARINLDADYIVGKPVQQIVDELRDLDFDLDVMPLPDGIAVGPGQVEIVSPLVGIERGFTVYVHYVPDSSGTPPT